MVSLKDCGNKIKFCFTNDAFKCYIVTGFKTLFGADWKFSNSILRTNADSSLISIRYWGFGN